MSVIEIKQATATNAYLRKDIKDCYKIIFPYASVPRDVNKIIDDLVHLYTYSGEIEPHMSHIAIKRDLTIEHFKPILERFELEV